jgi:hypothetical protein
MKIRPVGPGLFNADAATDMAMLIIAFRNFSNALQIIAYSTDRL